MACERVEDDQLWSWLDRGAGELETYLERFPDQRARVEGLRRVVGRLSREIPERIGDFTIECVLGEGGQAIVYSAIQGRPHRRVALKVFKSGVATSHRARVLFGREVESLARLQHPAIAAIHEIGTTGDGRPYLVMELVEGRPVTTWLVSRGAALSERLGLMVDVCRAVSHVHDQGILHRDLKPAHVIVDDDGHPRILDFGLAKLLDGSMDQSAPGSLAVGTLAYMAPEQLQGPPGSASAATDVYALGVILYEVLTGALPHDVGSSNLRRAVEAISTTPPRSLRACGVAASRDLEAVVARSLEKDPARRYRTAAAIADELDRILEGRPVLARPVGSAERAVRFLRRHRTAAVLGAATAALAVTAMGTVMYAEAAHRRQRQLAAESSATLSFVTDIIRKMWDQEPQGPLAAVAVANLATGPAAAWLDDVPLALAAVRAAAAGVRYREGDHAGWLEGEQQAYDLFREHAGKDDPRALDRLRRLLRFERREGAPDLEELRRLVEELRESWDAEPLYYLRGLCSLGSALLEDGRGPEARPILKAARDGFAEILGPDAGRTLRCRIMLARLDLASGQTGPALDELHELWRIAGQRAKTEGNLRLCAAANLAAALIEAGRLDEARPFVDKVLRSDTAPYQLRLRGRALDARIIAARGEYVEAERRLRDAHQSAVTKLGESNLLALMALTHLVKVYRDAGWADAMLESADRLVAGWHRAWRLDHPGALTARMLRADALGLCGRVDEAIDELGDVRGLLERSAGADHALHRQCIALEEALASGAGLSAGTRY